MHGTGLGAMGSDRAPAKGSGGPNPMGDVFDDNYDTFKALLDTFSPSEVVKRLEQFGVEQEVVQRIRERHERETMVGGRGLLRTPERVSHEPRPLGWQWVARTQWAMRARQAAGPEWGEPADRVGHHCVGRTPIAGCARDRDHR